MAKGIPSAQNIASANVIANTPASPLLATCSNAFGSFATSASTSVCDTTVAASLEASFLSQKAFSEGEILVEDVVSLRIPRVTLNDDDEEKNKTKKVINDVECIMMRISAADTKETNVQLDVPNY